MQAFWLSHRDGIVAWLYLLYGLGWEGSRSSDSRTVLQKISILASWKWPGCEEVLAHSHQYPRQWKSFESGMNRPSMKSRVVGQHYTRPTAYQMRPGLPSRADRAHACDNWSSHYLMKWLRIDHRAQRPYVGTVKRMRQSSKWQTFWSMVFLGDAWAMMVRRCVTDNEMMASLQLLHLMTGTGCNGSSHEGRLQLMSQEGWASSVSATSSSTGLGDAH